MKEKEIHDRLKTALNMLIKADKFLLEVDANERSISHKLGCYLAQQFAGTGWDVDCEYNRVGQEDLKKVLRRSFSEVARCYRNRNPGTSEVAVYPDIIIHKRGKPINLVVIEVKKAGNEPGKECDLLKLQKYKSQLGYTFPFFIEFDTSIKPPFRVFDEEGKEIDFK